MSRIAITMGDTNGIGPEILARASTHAVLREGHEIVVYGSRPIYDRVSADVAEASPSTLISSIEDISAHPGELCFLKDDVVAAEYTPGIISAEAGDASMRWIDAAVDATVDGRVDAVVTCPINKEGIHRAGYTCSGHTDFIAEKVGAPRYWMSLFAEHMRIVHLTGHLSLRDALDAITTERIIEAIHAGHNALERLGLPARRVAVAGVNPHASESGAFGAEEADILLPAITECRAAGIDCSGPHPADTVFRRMMNGEFDIVIAMYHDQGHTPLKMVAMDTGVNVTLGLPIVRTSVDHGTAYDIAGLGIAEEGSLCAAIQLAGQLASSRALEDAPTAP